MDTGYMNITMKEMARKLKEYPAYQIYYHKSPDGDAVTSAYALALALKSLGIPCEPVCCDPIPPAYRYLTDPHVFEPLEGCTAIAVDSANAKRLGKNSHVKITLCIDHHENTMEAEFRYVDPERSSCAELIYELIQEMGVPMTKVLADLLYVGLVTDTRCFRTYSTNVRSLEAAAAMARDGADIVGIARRHELEKDARKIEIEKTIMNHFHYSCAEKVLGTWFSWEDMQRIGVDETELGGLALIVDQISGLDIGILIREKSPGHCSVSVRSYRKDINAVEICSEYGGGGHADRAGFELEGDPAAVLSTAEEAAARYLSAQHTVI